MVDFVEIRKNLLKIKDEIERVREAIVLNSPNREELSELEARHSELQEEEKRNKLKLEEISTPLKCSWSLKQLDVEGDQGFYSPSIRFSSPKYESHTSV